METFLIVRRIGSYHCPFGSGPHIYDDIRVHADESIRACTVVKLSILPRGLGYSLRAYSCGQLSRLITYEFRQCKHVGVFRRGPKTAWASALSVTGFCPQTYEFALCSCRIETLARATRKFSFILSYHACVTGGRHSRLSARLRSTRDTAK